MPYYCEFCGAELPEGRITCPRCGAPTADQSQPPSLRRRSRSAAPSPGYDPDLRERENMPLSVWGFFWSDLLFRLPVIGVVVQLAWALGGAKNRNRRHYAIARLIWTILSSILFILGMKFFFHEIHNFFNHLLTHTGQILS